MREPFEENVERLREYLGISMFENIIRIKLLKTTFKAFTEQNT